MRKPFHQQRLLSAAECDAILDLWDQDHGHGRAYAEGGEYISKRTSIVELPAAIHRKIHDAVEAANAAYWGFEGTYARHHEIYRYDPGDFFDWHMDLGDGELRYRKLTTLVQLSRARDYAGGRLELFANEEHVASTTVGTLLIYPSFIMHRVTGITSGVRFSLGGEMLGEPYR